MKTPEAQLLTNMVVREYLLTSSLYAELDREQQAEAAGCEPCSWCIGRSDS